jgi:uncharacterized protein (DUF1330 family)
VQTLEGSWWPERVIIVEFPDMAQARAWYGSPEYAEGLGFRDAALSRDLILVGGVAPAA